MKIIILISILSFTTTAYSFDFNNLKNIFGLLDDTDPKVEIEDRLCCNPSAEELVQINQCAIDLCGNSGEVDSVYVSDSDYENFYRDDATLKEYNEFKPKLKKYLDFVREKTKSEIEAIKAKADPTQSEYFNLDSYTDDQISSLMSDELNASIQVEVKKDKNGKKKVSISSYPSEIEIDEQIKMKFIALKEDDMKSNFSSGIYSGYLELNEGKLFIEHAIKKHLSAIDEKITSIDPENTDELKSLNEKKEVYDRLKKEIEETKEYTKSNLTNFYYQIQAVDYSLTAGLDMDFYNVPYKGFKCEGLKCKEYLSKKIPHTMSQKNLQEIIDQTNNDKEANDLVDTCEYFWHSKRLQKAKDNKKQEFIDSLPKILSRVKSNFTAKFSNESSESLGKYFDKLKYAVADDPIPGRENFDHLEYIKEEVLKVVEPKKEEVEEDQTYVDPAGVIEGVIADYKNIKKHFRMGKPSFSHELTSCNGADAMASDHFKPAEYDPDTHIHISSFSCNHYTTGKQVLAHELGHAMSGQFMHNKTSKESYDKYSAHRNCITQRYKDKDFASKPLWKEFTHSGDTKYSEEDMADFVAGQIYSDPNEKLLSCALIARDENNVDYKRDKLSVLNPIAFDTHSSPFLRTLKEAILKDRVLTPSCRKIIDKYKDRINFNKCEF